MPRTRNYIFVPFSEKDDAKKLGALWDNKNKKFYVPSYLEKNIFSKWLTPPQKNQVFDENEAIQQFKNELETQGLIVDEPIMNGKLQRCQVNGDKGSEKSGAYVGFLDDYPAGYIENFKTGAKINWKFERGENKNYKNRAEKITEMKEKVKNSVNQKAQERNENLLKIQEKSALKMQNEWDNASQAPNNHSYLVNKKIIAKDLRIDRFGNLLIPLKDVNEKLWSLQRITKTGNKIIGIIKTEQERVNNEEFSARKKGCFYTQEPLENHESFQICEGFATAMSIQQITQKPTIMAVDSGNLINVCDELTSKYPNKNIIIFADNDLKKELENKSNVGLESALKCKKKYPKIKVIYPKIHQKEAEIITDFNDMLNQKGINFTKSNIENQKNIDIEKTTI